MTTNHSICGAGSGTICRCSSSSSSTTAAAAAHRPRYHRLCLSLSLYLCIDQQAHHCPAARLPLTSWQVGSVGSSMHGSGGGSPLSGRPHQLTILVLSSGPARVLRVSVPPAPTATVWSPSVIMLNDRPCQAVGRQPPSAGLLCTPLCICTRRRPKKEGEGQEAGRGEGSVSITCLTLETHHDGCCAVRWSVQGRRAR
jgi:hypothetical protein